jgi:hypothetical protein
MPALNFTVFIDQVIDGTKSHTIRELRKRPFKVCDDLSFFTGMRTTKCRRLRPNMLCTAASRITINAYSRFVYIHAGSRFYPEGELNRTQIDELAKRDGFDDADSFFRFFSRGNLNFRGQLVEWLP